MKLYPVISGSGMSGVGMAKAFSIIDILDSDVEVQPFKKLKRGEALDHIDTPKNETIICIGNPHGLHAQMLLEADRLGFKYIIADKPVCTKKNEIELLRNLSAKVAVCHGFRQNWGPQTIKKMIDSNELGEIITIEGRYWQSSAAFNALNNDKESGHWKNELDLSGGFDARVDLGAHWVDMMLFFAGEKPKSSRGWFSNKNSEAEHRDTHVHYQIDFSNFKTFGSVSKTVHGSGNDLWVQVLGTKKLVRWHVERPDELIVSAGHNTHIIQKEVSNIGSQQPPFHGLGWLEGYVDVIHNFVKDIAGDKNVTYPTLDQSLNVMETILGIEFER